MKQAIKNKNSTIVLGQYPLQLKVLTMKYLIVILISISCLSCKSQLTIYDISTNPAERTVSDNYYYKDLKNHYDSVIGIWKWELGNDSFELTIQKFEKHTDPIMSQNNIYRDELFGKYTYVKDGQIKSQVTTIGTFTDFHFSLHFKNPSEYGVVIRDVYSQRGKIGTFTITGPNEALMKLRVSEGVKLEYGNGLEWSLPDEMILVKQ